MGVFLSLSGGQNNTNPKGSIGGQRSDTTVTSDVLENFFDNISRSEALVGRTEYRLGYVYNSGPSHVSGVTIEVAVNPPITIMSIGLDPVGKGDGRTSGVAQSISAEDVTPSNVQFFGEDDLSSDGPYKIVRLPVGLLKSGECVPIWFKRVTESGSQQTISVTINIVHDAVTLPGEDFDDGGAIGELIGITINAAGTEFKVGTAKVGFSEVAANP